MTTQWLRAKENTAAESRGPCQACSKLPSVQGSEPMNDTCELCGKPLGEESVSASDGVNEPVRICAECAEKGRWQ